MTKHIAAACLGVAVLFAPAAPAAADPYIWFKFDDMSEQYGSEWWHGFRTATTSCKAAGAKCTVGIFSESVEAGTPDYLAYVQSLIADPDMEVWMHGYTGKGPEGRDGCEFTGPVPADGCLGSPYEFQKDHLVRGRLAMLSRFDFLMRTFSTHWHSANADTVRAFNEDPFFRVFPMYAPPGTNERSAYKSSCALEIGNTHVPVSLEQFIKNYDGCRSMRFASIQGHPWNWTRVQHQIFRDVLAYLKTQGAKYIRPWDLYKLDQGITDTTAPPAPIRVTLTRVNPTTIKSDWAAVTDPESGIDGYTVYRDGTFVGIVTETNYTDSASINLPDTVRYQVSAVNRASLFSPRSKGVSLRLRGR